MQARLLVGTLALLLAAPLAALARPADTPDPRKDTRPPIVEKMDTADFTCTAGHPVGLLAAVAVLGVALRRRR